MQSSQPRSFLGKLKKRWQRFTIGGKLGFAVSIFGAIPFIFALGASVENIVLGTLVSLLIMPLILGALPWIWKKYKEQPFDIWNFGFTWGGILIITIYLLETALAFSLAGI